MSRVCRLTCLMFVIGVTSLWADTVILRDGASYSGQFTGASAACGNDHELSTGSYAGAEAQVVSNRPWDRHLPVHSSAAPHPRVGRSRGTKSLAIFIFIFALQRRAFRWR